MNKQFPTFKYHPNPIETGNVKESDEICLCCHQVRGFIYLASFYTEENLDGSVCPWCIADGSAAEKFDGEFSADYGLLEAGIPKEIVEDVCKRTPSYISWQQQVWQAHCKDVCAFHGDADEDEIKNLDEESTRKFCFENDIENEVGKIILENYQKGGNPAIYKFVCLHCEEIKFYFDCT